jgi:hypothetical protein
MSLLRYLPTPTAEEIVSGRMRIVLGRQDYLLPVLPIERNEQWQRAEDAALGVARALLDEQKEAAETLAFLARQAETMYAQLVAYDGLGIDPELDRIERILPDWEAARKVATESQILAAFLTVLAFAYPLAVDLLRVTEVGLFMMASQATASEAPVSSVPTSRRERRSAGRRAKSAAVSPTPS